jgi:RNA polymerase sigma factor (TIGR02999 family)
VQRTVPSQDHAEEITAALAMLRRGAPEGMERLIPLVYAELRRLAHYQLGAEPAGHTLSTTALVHEAYLRLAEQDSNWSSQGQFFGIAARVMRRVLVDYARRHGAARRGGPRQERVSLEEADSGGGDALSVAAQRDELLALDDALERLATMDARLARVVECRFFGGLTEEETAEVLGVSRRTVASDWVIAKGWLYRALHTDDV